MWHYSRIAQCRPGHGITPPSTPRGLSICRQRKILSSHTKLYLLAICSTSQSRADDQILHGAELEEQHLKYRTTLLRSGVTQLADLLPRYVNRSNPVREVTRGNSVTGPGVGALLAQLIWAICEEGEGVLMTTVRTLLSNHMKGLTTTALLP